MPLGLRAEILVADIVILEIKAVPALLPPSLAGPFAHEAQFLTDLRLSGLPLGPLMNVHTMRLKNGLKRVVAS